VTVRRGKRVAPHWTVDAAGAPIEVGGHCGLHVDLQPEASAPMRGDWVATEAGSRYLVDDVRMVRSRRHAQVKRYQLQVLRLPKGTEPPEDVHVIWLTWYPRARSSR
jgi:hypothetical protein